MIAIINAFRSPIGTYGGSLKDIEPDELVSIVMKNNLSEAGFNGSFIDEVIIGQTKQSAHYPNIARLASLKAGIPESTPSYTVNMQCGSAMQAIINGVMSISTGQSEIVLAGGVESMSQAPHYMINDRFSANTGDVTLFDSNIESQPRSQPEDIYGRFSMGQTAEVLARKYNISREEQDHFAFNSQEKTRLAIETNRFSDEIVPVLVKRGRNDFAQFSQDEFPRKSTKEKIGKLKPVFEEGGTVTAGNSTGRNDGAAVLLLMSESKVEELGLVPLAYIKSFASAGVTPKEMGLGPVVASEKALSKAGLTMDDMSLIELNEAFAAQSLAVLKEWKVDEKKVNVNGGAIALGHPLGSSGARIVVTLVHELNKQKKRFGLATLCIAGGQGIAMVVERNGN